MVVLMLEVSFLSLHVSLLLSPIELNSMTLMMSLSLSLSEVLLKDFFFFEIVTSFEG